jgi:hypothetical protein
MVDAMVAAVLVAAYGGMTAVGARNLLRRRRSAVRQTSGWESRW